MRLNFITLVPVFALAAVPVVTPSVAYGQAGMVDERAMDAAIEAAGAGIGDANDEEDIIRARQKIIGEYKFWAERGGGYTFARKAAAGLTPLLGPGLKTADPLLALKVVNTAMALSRMPEVTIQQALDTMVAHENPAARLLGWTGYLQTRGRLLSQGEVFAERMYAALDKAGRSENAPPVLAVMFRMLKLGPRPAGISDGAWRKARLRWLGVLERNWRRWCKKVAAGEAEMAVASQALIEAALTHAVAAAAEQKDPKKLKAAKKPFVQMVYDMAWSASLAYKNAYGEAGAGTRTVRDNGALLRECERALNALTGLKHGFIVGALTKDEDRDRAARVRLAVVYHWLEALAGDYGVIEPKFEEPASRPAATSPAE